MRKVIESRAIRSALLLWATASVVGMLSTAPISANETDRVINDSPNLVFIFADDHCYKAIRALGNEEIHTPNLDRLARRGTTFTHAYNMGSWSGAVCVASRTMLNTGRFLWRAKDVYQQAEAERQAGRFWSEYLKQAGYQTYFTGKWHVPAKVDRAFDVVDHVRGGMPNQTEQGYNRPIDGVPDPWSPSDPQFGGFWTGGKHWSEVVADDAVRYVDMAAADDAPFFMYLAFNAPHDPRQAPQLYVDLYPREYLSVPPGFQEVYPYHDLIGCGPNLRDEMLAPFPRTAASIRAHRQEYYAIITHMDAQIGRILDAVDAMPNAENTYIFFTADHGLAVGHHGLVGKQNLYDHSIRVPFMAVGPDIRAGAQIDEPIYLQDIMPTTLELAGVDRPEHVEFQSLLPMLHESAASSYSEIYGAYLDLQRMIIADGFKLILYPQAKVARLYNLQDDAYELHDLAASAEHRETMSELGERLLELQREMGDSLDLTATFGELLQ